MPKYKDLTGTKIGMVTAISPAESRNGRWFWNFHCDCGKDFIGCGADFSHGSIKSCGCVRKHKASENAVARNTTHGMKNSRIYRIWSGMKNRCGKGSYENIQVCPEWENFETFLEWATKTGYKETLTIDRIDPRGNYSPENCRWADYTTQENNRTNNRIVKFHGMPMTAAECARKAGIKYSTFLYRLNKGLSPEEAAECRS